jgi:hypothetical protein
MNRVRFLILTAAALLAGCVSPYSKMEQNDLRGTIEDRYQFANEMPVSNQDEAIDKVHAYWETLEALNQVKEKQTQVVLDGQSMPRDDAKKHVRDRIHDTERGAEVGWDDYCGRACWWGVMIPVKVAMTPCEAFLIGIESPCADLK